MRRRRAVAAGTAATLLLAGILLATGGDAEDRRLVPGGAVSDEQFDPLAFDSDAGGELERAAAAGFSHVLYEKSPGGARATATRTARWRAQVEQAAARSGTNADLLEAIVFLESAGRPEVVAGGDLSGAAGLTQIVAETGINLLGLRVDLPASRRLTRRIGAAERSGQDATAQRLRAARRRVDERFDPPKALAATTRYLAIARERFGREDLAIASYHMGIGNLDHALRAYTGEHGEEAIDEVVEQEDLSYARLYFDSTPLLHAEAYRRLAALGDDSATYLWRVFAAREIMRLSREAPGELARLESLHAAKASAEEVLHPRAATEVFPDPEAVKGALDSGRLVALPEPAPLFLAFDARMGELAPRLRQAPTLYRALRPEALALLVYLAAGVQAVSGEAPLVVTSTVRDVAYQRLLLSGNGEATRGYSLHTAGYAFDVLREYRSRRQALAFDFWLTRLQALNLIAWVREPAAIHVTVSREGSRLLPLLEDL